MKKKSIILQTTMLLVLCSLIMTGCMEENEHHAKVTKIEKKKKEIKQNSYFYPVKDSITKIDKRETAYVPVYSHVYTSEDKYEPVGITLSVRNTDFTQNLLVENISYYNTSGDLIETYIEQPYILKPMASIDFIIDLRDMRGGSGANFIVKWAGSKELSTPIIQAVMVNNSVNRAFSFITDSYTVK